MSNLDLSNSSFSVQAVRTEPNGVTTDGQLHIEFTVFGDLMLKWQQKEPEPPTVEDELGVYPKGDYRWTAFQTHGKRYTVVLVGITPPYGCWWLGTADTLEQAEHIFHKWLTTSPSVTLGPSRSIGDYGI